MFDWVIRGEKMLQSLTVKVKNAENYVINMSFKFIGHPGLQNFTHTYVFL